MIKPKPHYCIICKKEIFIRSSFERSTKLTCGSSECALEFIKFHPEKARKVHDKMVKKDLKEIKERVGNKKPDKSVLQDIVNSIARLIDKDQNCISCAGVPKSRFGGHRWNVKENTNLRYNLHGIRTQCYSCNDRKSGNGDGYDKGLLEKFGQRYFEYVKFDLKRIYSYVGLSTFDLKEKIKIARSIEARLKKADKVYSREEQISLRDDINDEIGIYTSRFHQI